MQRLVLAAAMVLAVAACGGDSRPVFGEPGGTTIPSSGDTGSTAATTTTSGDSSTTTTTTTTTTTQPTTTSTTFDPVTVLAGGDFEPTEGVDATLAGLDTTAAAAITAGLEAEGIDLSGVELWVFPVPETGETMLVLTADAAADQLAEDEEGAFFATLATLPAITDFGIDRFTLHYYDTDEEGPFVLTTTMPFSLFVDITVNGAEPDETMVGIQMQRLDP